MEQILGTYNECTISISDGDITDTGEIDELIVVSDSEEDYVNSLVTSETANEEGTFVSSVIILNVEGGEYATLLSQTTQERPFLHYQ